MFKSLNSILHSQLRLAIISYLMANSSADFNELKKVTGATSGNLSIQLKKLQNVRYVKITKSYKNNYPHTLIEITKNGLNAFEEYVKAIKEYLG